MFQCMGQNDKLFYEMVTNVGAICKSIFLFGSNSIHIIHFCFLKNICTAHNHGSNVHVKNRSALLSAFSPMKEMYLST